MFLILRFVVGVDCGTAPQKWRSAAQSVLGLEGRRIWESQRAMSWSWSGSGSGGKERQDAASLAQVALLSWAMVLFVVFPL